MGEIAQGLSTLPVHDCTQTLDCAIMAPNKI